MPKGTIPRQTLYHFTPPATTDGTVLPEEWRSLPARWVLDLNYWDHCDACSKYAGIYTSYGSLLHHTSGAKPGYFPTCAIRGTRFAYYNMLVSCGEECTCHIEILYEGEWRRVLLD